MWPRRFGSPPGCHSRSIADVEAMHAQIFRGAERTAAWLRGFAG